MNQPRRASVVAPHLRVAERPQPGAGDVPQVAAEVEQDRGHRPELDDRRERGARVLPAQERRDDAQVAAAGDRQELGEALDDAQDDRFERAHGSGATYAIGPSRGSQPCSAKALKRAELRVVGAVEVRRAGRQQAELLAAARRRGGSARACAWRRRPRRRRCPARRSARRCRSTSASWSRSQNGCAQTATPPASWIERDRLGDGRRRRAGGSPAARGSGRPREAARSSRGPLRPGASCSRDDRRPPWTDAGARPAGRRRSGSSTTQPSSRIAAAIRSARGDAVGAEAGERLRAARAGGGRCRSRGRGGPPARRRAPTAPPRARAGCPQPPPPRAPRRRRPPCHGRSALGARRPRQRRAAPRRRAAASRPSASSATAGRRSARPRPVRARRPRPLAGSGGRRRVDVLVGVVLRPALAERDRARAAARTAASSRARTGPAARPSTPRSAAASPASASAARPGPRRPDRAPRERARDRRPRAPPRPPRPAARCRRGASDARPCPGPYAARTTRRRCGPCRSTARPAPHAAAESPRVQSA